MQCLHRNFLPIEQKCFRLAIWRKVQIMPHRIRAHRTHNDVWLCQYLHSLHMLPMAFSCIFKCLSTDNLRWISPWPSEKQIQDTCVSITAANRNICSLINFSLLCSIQKSDLRPTVSSISLDFGFLESISRLRNFSFFPKAIFVRLDNWIAREILFEGTIMSRN